MRATPARVKNVERRRGCRAAHETSANDWPRSCWYRRQSGAQAGQGEAKGRRKEVSRLRRERRRAGEVRAGAARAAAGENAGRRGEAADLLDERAQAAGGLCPLVALEQLENCAEPPIEKLRGRTRGNPADRDKGGEFGPEAADQLGSVTETGWRQAGHEGRHGAGNTPRLDLRQPHLR